MTWLPAARTYQLVCGCEPVVARAVRCPVGWRGGYAGTGSTLHNCNGHRREKTLTGKCEIKKVGGDLEYVELL